MISALWEKPLLTICFFHGYINSDILRQWVIQQLLVKAPDHAVIVIDNANFYKSAQIQKTIADTGYILQYLLTYSPDLNPIGHKWTPAKAIGRERLYPVNELFKEHVYIIIIILFIYATVKGSRCEALIRYLWPFSLHEQPSRKAGSTHKVFSMESPDSFC